MIFISDCQFCTEAPNALINAGGQSVGRAAEHCGAPACREAWEAVRAPIRFTDGSRGRIDTDGAVQMAQVALLRLLAVILWAGLALGSIGGEVAK